MPGTPDEIRPVSLIPLQVDLSIVDVLANRIYSSLASVASPTRFYGNTYLLLWSRFYDNPPRFYGPTYLLLRLHSAPYGVTCSPEDLRGLWFRLRTAPRGAYWAPQPTPPPRCGLLGGRDTSKGE